VNAEPEEHGAVSNAVHKRKARGLVRRMAQLKPEDIFVAVHRLDFMVYYRRLDPVEFRILQALGGGMPVGEAVEAGVEDSSIPVSELRKLLETWFAMWSEMGWLCHPVPKEHRPS
jgi:hypothetical protein